MGTKNLNSATDLITFSRASGGTALRKISYGSELVTNGDFATGDLTFWDTDGIGSYSGPTSFSVVSNQLQIGNTTGGYIQWGSNAIDVSAVNYVTVSYTLVSKTSRVDAYFSKSSQGAGDLVANVPSVGTYTYTFDVSDSSVLYLSWFSAAGATAVFDNISVKEVLFDQPDGTLQLYNHLDNTPRIEYNPDGTVKGLLIEEARTNLQPDNNSLEIKSVTNLTTTANATTAPDGTNTAVKLAINAGETSSPRLLVGSGQNNPSNVSSIFAKAGEGSFNKIGLGAYNGGGYTAIAYFDLTTGTFDYIHRTSNRNISDYGIEPVGNGWYRIWIKPLNDSGTGFVFVVSDDSTSASSATAGNGSDGLYIWGHQVEAGAFPTSYIPTTGSTATRAADVASIPVSAFGYNQGVGSLFIEADRIIKTTGGGTGVIADINNGGVADQISVSDSNSLRGQLILDSTGGSNDVSITVSGAEGNDFYAAGWKLNDTNIAHGGVLGTKDTSNIPIKTATTLTLSSDFNNNAKFSGHIKSIKYYPRRLSDTQLQELTT